MDLKLLSNCIEPDSPRPAPPSDENITADIICQPYIYRDAYSTGLTGLSMLANLPLTVAYTSDGNPSDAIVTNSEQMRITFRRLLPQVPTEPSQQSRNQEDNTDEITAELQDTQTNDEEAARDTDSLPPDYSNITNVRLEIETEGEESNSNVNDDDEPPPPSYYECVIKSGTNSDSVAT